MMNLKTWLLLLPAIILLATSCKKDPATTTPVDLSTVKMNDFQLVETPYATIQITHPTVSNGVETAPGTIRITIPAGSTNLQLTPRTSNFTNTAFTVMPALGMKQDFSSGAVVYTITSKTDAAKKVRYNVIITENTGTNPGGGGIPKITGFKFERSLNAQLPADVDAAGIVEGVATLGKIYVFVPAGTDFSALRPTISFDGAAVYYSQDRNSAPQNATDVYPAGGLTIDFAYPKVFYLVVKRGTDAQVYDVVVDVKKPIVFDDAAVTLPGVVFGAGSTLPATQLLNRGNHPISIAAITHTAQLPAGTNAVRAAAAFPSLGLLPGQRAQVSAVVSAGAYPPGSYGATAVFAPKLHQDEGSAAHLDASTLPITATITN